MKGIQDSQFRIITQHILGVVAKARLLCSSPWQFCSELLFCPLNDVHIWQMSLQPRLGDICRIQMWDVTGKLHLFTSENDTINERWKQVYSSSASPKSFGFAKKSATYVDMTKRIFLLLQFV